LPFEASFSRLKKAILLKVTYRILSFFVPSMHVLRCSAWLLADCGDMISTIVLTLSFCVFSRRLCFSFMFLPIVRHSSVPLLYQIRLFERFLSVVLP